MTARMQMGSNGLKCSRIIAGFWRLKNWNYSTQQLLDFIYKCLDVGVTTMDHADIYGDYSCESIFGKAITGKTALRDKMQIITKCGICLQNSENRPGVVHQHYNTGFDHIITSVERSLKNLNTDYIDVLLIHRPDALMDAHETARAFDNLLKEGKVRYFGVSNFSPSQFNLIQSRLQQPLITNQIECSVSFLDPMYDGTLDQCQQLRVSPMAWSPLSGGNLFTDDSEKTGRIRNVLKTIGMEAGLNGQKTGEYGIDQVAIAWLLRHPSNIFPVLGTSKPERIRSAVDALEIMLSREQWYRIWSASTGTPVP